jgi:hypothetical protein
MRPLLALAISAALIFSVVYVLAGEKTYVVKENEELYGTWENPNYVGGKSHGTFRKVIFRADMTFENFRWLEGQDVGVYSGAYNVTDKWTDSKGNVWYRVHWKTSLWEHYGLFKVSNSGNKCEFVTDPIEYGYPKKIDPKAFTYRVYYRKRR